MNIEEIRLLAEIVRENSLTLLEVSEGETRVHLERRAEPSALTLLPQELPPPALPMAEEQAAVDFNRLTEVKAPMVGVFYAAPSPDTAPFVQRGDRVKRGDVLCIIEAMKLMNEIIAETDGEIADICVQNGQVVEYGQTLMKIY